MSLQAILQEMADVCNAVSSVGIAYPLPPEAAPPSANLPAVIPEVSTGEIAWGTSHDDRRHAITLHILVGHGDIQQTQLGVLLPVFEDVMTAFQTNITLGLSYVYDCHPVSYEIGPVAYGDAEYYGASILFTVKEKVNVSFR